MFRKLVHAESPDPPGEWEETPPWVLTPARESNFSIQGVRHLRMNIHQADKERGNGVLSRGNRVCKGLDVGRVW